MAEEWTLYEVSAASQSAYENWKTSYSPEVNNMVKELIAEGFPLNEVLEESYRRIESIQKAGQEEWLMNNRNGGK